MDKHGPHVVRRLVALQLLVLQEVIRQLQYLVLAPHESPLVRVYRDRPGGCGEQLRKAMHGHLHRQRL